MFDSSLKFKIPYSRKEVFGYESNKFFGNYCRTVFIHSHG